jgi:hypothetical protein
MADDSAYAEAMGKVLRDPADPAERAPQRIFHDGVLIQNWVEDRTSNIRRMSATAPRTVQHYPALPTGYESSAAAANTKMVTAQRTYVAPPWRQHTEPYSNISLMDNWFEDRFSHDLVRQTGLRTMSPAVHGREEQADMLRTTKQVEGHAFTTAARVQPRLQPRLFTLRGATATVHADRTTGAPERGFGATLPRHDEAEGAAARAPHTHTHTHTHTTAPAARAQAAPPARLLPARARPALYLAPVV